MNTPEILDCGHSPDAGTPYSTNGALGWQWAYALDGKRKLCHACKCLEVLDCGHPIGPHSPIATGYGTDPDTGKRICFQCCADLDRAAMLRDGHITLYLSEYTGGSLSVHSNRDRARVTNWPGSLSFPVHALKRSPRGGGFGSQRTDAWFRGPDGYVWHAINRGDSQIARCKRTKEK